MLHAAGHHLFELIVIVVHFGATSVGGCTTSTRFHLLIYTTSDAFGPRFNACPRNGTVDRWLSGNCGSALLRRCFIQGPHFLSSRHNALSALYVRSIRSVLSFDSIDFICLVGSDCSGGSVCSGGCRLVGRSTAPFLTKVLALP